LYKENARKLVTEFSDLHRELKEKLAPYNGLKIVTFHKAWSYFARDFGLNVVGVIEPKIGITPSPADIKHTIDLMKHEGVKVVVVETYNSFSDAKVVADGAGARAIVLPDHVNGVAAADTYQKLFRYDVDKLIEAANAR
jgi:ABC-type Zn uptake system ZnuABC Zn-binding protein ZnuA